VHQSADRQRPQAGLVHPETLSNGGGKGRYPFSVMSAGAKELAFHNIQRFRYCLDEFIHSDVHK
jgi:hypothetical protein